MKRILLLILNLLFAGNVLGQVINEGYGEYNLVPAGEFQMGDNFNEGDDDELPVHTVYLDSFYIGKYEVTNEEYKKFIADRGYKKKEYWIAGGFLMFVLPKDWRDTTFKGGGYPGNEKFPVVGVSWYEAMAYAKWLSKETGKTYRLPTEAEWEKAARGTSQRKYPWGSDLDEHYANFSNTGYPFGSGITPVGFFDGTDWGNFVTKSNESPYNIYDMAGNVWEWCLDFYGKNYFADSVRENPKGPFFGGYRVVRGGGWNSDRKDLRCPNRHFYFPHFRYFNSGFRCVREK